MARPALPLLLLLLAVAAVATAPVVRAGATEDGTRRRLLQDVVGGNSTDTNANGTAPGYISYGALLADTVPCSYPGASYYNCRPGAEANPYERGCSEITRCRD